MKQRFTKSGFTLIELLAVMAIIAILAAIIVPKIGDATGKAKRLSCANNMKNIVKAMSIYEDDFNESVCGAVTVPTTTLIAFGNLYYSNTKTLSGTASTGLTAMDIYHCPATTGTAPGHGDFRAALTGTIDYGIVVTGATTANIPSYKTDPDTNTILFEVGLNHGGRNLARWDSKVYFQPTTTSPGTEYPNNISPTTGATVATEVYADNQVLGVGGALTGLGT